MKSVFVLLLFCWSNTIIYSQSEMNQDPEFAAFQLEELKSQMEGPWLAFFKNENVLTGIYRLQPGQEDRQQPHDTDEVYYVISGNGKFVAGETESEVKEGSILFVKADVEHRFFDITEELVLLVFFDQ